jgi:hypothetical protein
MLTSQFDIEWIAGAKLSVISQLMTASLESIPSAAACAAWPGSCDQKISTFGALKASFQHSDAPKKRRGLCFGQTESLGCPWWQKAPQMFVDRPDLAMKIQFFRPNLGVQRLCVSSPIAFTLNPWKCGSSNAHNLNVGPKSSSAVTKPCCLRWPASYSSTLTWAAMGHNMEGAHMAGCQGTPSTRPRKYQQSDYG